MSFVATITANIDDFSKNLKKAGKDMNKFQSDVKTGGVNVDSSLKKTGTSMNALSSTAKQAGAVIASAFAFTAVLRGLRSFIFANADFEQSLANLSALTGAVGDDLEFYKKQAIEMGAVTTLTASQVSEAFMLIGSAQPQLLKAKESLAQVTKEAITLAEAAGLQLPDAARALTGAMNQFKISADSASEVINVLAAGSKEGSADINSLNQSLTNVGTVAFSAGLSIQQTVGALETLAENQIKGAEAGTALRGVIMKLQASGLGYASGVFNLSDALKEAKESIDSHTTAVEKDARSQEIFGIINTTAGKILMQNVDTYHRLTDAVTGTTTAYDQQATNTSTLNASFLALKSAIEGIVLSFGESNGMIKSVVDSLVNMLNNVRENIDVYKRWGKTLLSIGATFATAAIAMKAFTVASTAMKVATMVLSGQFALLNTVMMANPFVAVAAAVVALTVYIVDLWKKSETFRAKFKYATEMVAYYFQVAWINIKKGAEIWWEGMKAYFTAIPKLAQAAGKAIKAIFSGGNFADTFKGELNRHFENVKQNAIDIKNKYNDELSQIKPPDYAKILAGEFGVKVEDKVSGKYLPDAINETTDSVDNLGDSLDKLGTTPLIPQGSLKELSEKLKSLYEQLDNETTQSGRIKVANLINDLESKVVRIKVGIEMANTNIEGISAGQIDAPTFDLNSAIDKMGADLDRMKAVFDEKNQEIAQTVQSLNSIVVGGFTGMFAALGDALGSGSSVLDSLGNALLGGIGSMAVQLGQLAIGIGGAVFGIKKALQSLNPVVAIAAGVALVTLGSFAKSAASSIGSGGGGYARGAGGYQSTRVEAPIQQGEFDMRNSYQSFPDKIELVARGSDLGAVIDMNNTRRNRTI